MSFNRPDTIKVERYKLLAIKGTIGEVRRHLDNYSMEHPAHRAFVDTRLETVEKLAEDLYGYHPHECTD